MRAGRPSIAGFRSTTGTSRRSPEALRGRAGRRLPSASIFSKYGCMRRPIRLLVRLAIAERLDLADVGRGLVSPILPEKDVDPGLEAWSLRTSKALSRPEASFPASAWPASLDRADPEIAR